MSKGQWILRGEPVPFFSMRTTGRCKELGYPVQFEGFKSHRFFLYCKMPDALWFVVEEKSGLAVGSGTKDILRTLDSASKRMVTVTNAQLKSKIAQGIKQFNEVTP